MKLKEIIDRIDRSQNNMDYIATCDIAEEFEIYNCPYIDPEVSDLKAYWFRNWMCTDTVVGYKAYFLKDECVAVSVQQARKSDENFYWASKEAYYKVKEYLLSLIKEERDYIQLLNPEENIDETYKLDFGTELLYEHNTMYNGQPVKVVEKIKDEYFLCERVIIEFKDGTIKEVNVKELDIPINII